jgi:hypothetical protein
MPGVRARVAVVAAALRQRTWDDMSRDIVALVNARDASYAADPLGIPVAAAP